MRNSWSEEIASHGAHLSTPWLVSIAEWQWRGNRALQYVPWKFKPRQNRMSGKSSRQTCAQKHKSMHNSLPGATITSCFWQRILKYWSSFCHRWQIGTRGRVRNSTKIPVQSSLQVKLTYRCVQVAHTMIGLRCKTRDCVGVLVSQLLWHAGVISEHPPIMIHYDISIAADCGPFHPTLSTQNFNMIAVHYNVSVHVSQHYSRNDIYPTHPSTPLWFLIRSSVSSMALWAFITYAHTVCNNYRLTLMLVSQCWVA